MPNGRPRCGLRFQNPLRGPGAEFAGFIPKPVKKLEKLFIAPKVRQVLYETSQRVFTRCACARRTGFLIKFFNQESVLVTVCLRTLCVRAQYESVLHLFENNSGPGSVYRLRLQSAHKPPGPPLLLYPVPEAIIGVCPLFFPLLPHEPVSHFTHCSRYCSRQRPFSWMSWAYSLPTYR